MPVSGVKEGDLFTLADGDDSGCENPLSFGVLRLEVSGKCEDPHGCVVVMEDLSLRALSHELEKGRVGLVRHPLGDIPLRRCRKGDLEVFLEPFHAMEGKSASVFHAGDDGARGLVVFFIPHPIWKLRREDLAAEVAAEPFTFINGG